MNLQLLFFCAWLFFMGIFWSLRIISFLWFKFVFVMIHTLWYSGLTKSRMILRCLSCFRCTFEKDCFILISCFHNILLVFFPDLRLRYNLSITCNCSFIFFMPLQFRSSIWPNRTLWIFLTHQCLISVVHFAFFKFVYRVPNWRFVRGNWSIFGKCLMI